MTRKFDAIVFDLDGTLWDTTPACAVAWNQVLATEKIAYREIVAEDVKKVTGMPHDECIRCSFEGLNDDEINRMIETTAVVDNEVIEELGGVLYEGVLDGLKVLSKEYKLSVVSNCQTGYIENFVRLNKLEGIFTDIECYGNTLRPKGNNLRSVIDRNGFENPLMVGDTTGDEDAARFCGVSFAFVSYGFGNANSPDYRFDSFGELLAFFLRA